MVRANSTCCAERLLVAVHRELLGEDEQPVQRRAQLVRHVGEELGLVLRGQRELLGLLLECLAGLLDLAVLALHLGVLLGEERGLLLQLGVGLLELVLPALQLGGERLRLLSRSSVRMLACDGVEHDADALRELVEELLVGVG